MTSGQFVNFLEAKLTEHGAGKVIPNAAMLNEAYRLFEREEWIEAVVDAALARRRNRLTVPADLAKRVRAYLAGHPAASWIEAAEALAEASQHPPTPKSERRRG